MIPAVLGVVASQKAQIVPLKIASSTNKTAFDRIQVPSSLPRVAHTWTHRICGSHSALAVNFHNYYMSANGELSTGNDLTIVECYVRHSNGTSAQVTLAGNNSWTVANGETDLVSDDILPAAFGLSEFSDGDFITLKFILGVVPTQYLPYSVVIKADYPTGSQAAAYDPANTTISASSAAGIYTVTAGTAFNEGLSQGYYPTLVGRPIVSTSPILLIGDSIGQGVADNANKTYWGRGYYQTAMREADNSAPVAFMNAARLSVTSRRFADGVKWRDYIKYHDRAIIELGTNDLTTIPFVFSTYQGYIDTAIAALKAGGINLILMQKLIARTTGTWTSTAQTPITNWGAGEGVDLINGYIDTLVTNGVVTGSFDITALHSSYIWVPNMTGDGTHPNNAGATAAVPETRTARKSF